MRPGDPNLEMLEVMGHLTERDCPGSLHDYLQAEFALLHADPMFAEAVSGFLPGDTISQTQAPLILHRIAALAGQA
jgi:hypothetical protein